MKVSEAVLAKAREYAVATFGASNAHHYEACGSSQWKMALAHALPDDPDREFEYVVARPWEPGDPDSRLCIYSYHTELQRGTQTSAQSFLDYVRRQAPTYADAWGIYAVSLTRQAG